MSKVFIINGENASLFSEFENSITNPKNLKKIGATEVFTLDFNISKIREVLEANRPPEGGIFNIIINAHGNGDFNTSFRLDGFGEVSDLLINISRAVGDNPVNIFLDTCYAARIFDLSMPFVKGSKIFTLPPKDKTSNAYNEQISEDLMLSLLEFLKTNQELSVIEKVTFTIITNHQLGEINPQLCMIDESGGNVLSLKDVYNSGKLNDIWENSLSEIDIEEFIHLSNYNYDNNIKKLETLSSCIEKVLLILPQLNTKEREEFNLRRKDDLAHVESLLNKNENINANELCKLLVMFYVFSTNKEMQDKFTTYYTCCNGK